MQNRRQILYLHSVPSNICPHPEAMSLRRVSCGKKSQQAERTVGLVGSYLGVKAGFSLSAVGLGASQFRHPQEDRDPNLAEC